MDTADKGMQGLFKMGLSKMGLFKMGGRGEPGLNKAADRHAAFQTCQRARNDRHSIKAKPIDRRAPEVKTVSYGVPERIRTSGPQIRNLMLYPAELRGRTKA